MNIVGLIVFGAAVAATTSSASPKVTEPYGLRGVRLGITVDEFRVLPIPLPPGSAPAEVRCSDQPYVLGGPFLTQREKDARVLRCEWGTRSAYGVTGTRVEIANAEGKISFDFITPPNSLPRLFRMGVSFKRSEWDNIVPSFERAYGPPKTMDGQVQNKLGATFQAGSYLWSNGVSEIEISDRCGDIDEMCLVLVHSQLSEEYVKALDAHAAAGADKL